MVLRRQLSIFVWLGSLVAALLTPTPAHAATHVFEINCSQSPGFNATAPGTYLLRRAVVNCGSEPAIRVSVSNVVVDLRGRAIEGTGGSFGILVAPDIKNVTIRNGVVSNFVTGIDLGSTQSVVTRMVARSNSNRGIRASPGNTISRNIATRNGLNGIVATSRVTVSGNGVSGNAFDGINAGDDNIITGNKAFGNGLFGIRAVDESTISGNTVYGNGAVGIGVFNDNSISGNVALGNSGSGVLAVDTNRIFENVLSGNATAGLQASGERNKILRNTLNGNGADGMLVQQPFNVVKANKANGNAGNGIAIDPSAGNNTVADNTMKGNVLYGISTPVAEGGGRTNKAQDNGQSPQCSQPTMCIVQPDSAGFDVTCSPSVDDPVGTEINTAGTHRLRRAVNDCNSVTAAIRVNASNVVVDLQGRLVDGNGAGTAGIIVAPGRQNVTVRNGAVSNFDNGIDVDGTANVVTAMITRHNDFHGMTGGAGNMISKSTATQNGFSGIQVDGNATVKNSVIAGNRDTGIFGASFNTITNNVVAGNGIPADALSAKGIDVDNESKVSGNRVSGNEDFGILATDDNEISTNNATANGDVGISATNGNAVLANTVKGNAFDGIAVGDANRVIENRSSGNRGDGIWVVANNFVKLNVANGNLQQNGIRVVSPSVGTTVARNTANGNTFLGINAGDGPVQGGKTNKAKDNFQPEQCRPNGTCVT